MQYDEGSLPSTFLETVQHWSVLREMEGRLSLLSGQGPTCLRWRHRQPTSCWVAQRQAARQPTTCSHWSAWCMRLHTCCASESLVCFSMKDHFLCQELFSRFVIL